MIVEVFYLGHDNSIDLLLKSNGAAVDLSPVTKMALEIRGVTTLSTEDYPELIQWAGSLERGRVVIDLNKYSGTLPTGKFVARLIVYDPLHPHGIVWGEFVLYIRD